MFKSKYLKLLQYNIFFNRGFRKKKVHAASSSPVSNVPVSSDILIIEGNVPDNWQTLPALCDGKLIPVNYPDINILLPRGNWLVYFTTTYISNLPNSVSKIKSVFVKWDLINDATLCVEDSDYSLACFGRYYKDVACIFRVDNKSNSETIYSISGKAISCNYQLSFYSKPKIWAEPYED